MRPNEKPRVTVTAKDLEITACRGSGPGGQARNKTSNAIVIRHPASGVTVRCESHRSQRSNKTEALRKLSEHPKFMAWASMRLREMEDGETLDQRVDRMMSKGDIKVEVRDEDGLWAQEGAS